MTPVQDACLDLMSNVEPSCPPHMREALCRPLVEMVKREWPQQYPEFMTDMDQLAAKGPLHTELVLRVFLRLAEDVATFQVCGGQGEGCCKALRDYGTGLRLCENCMCAVS